MSSLQVTRARSLRRDSGDERGYWPRRTLLVEQRERLALRIKAARQGDDILDDAEYEAGLRELALESLETLSDDEIRRELERRQKQLATNEQEQTDGPDSTTR